jgi:cytidylate kinase
VACRAVCISRAEGAGGSQTAQLVAERLGFRYIDDEIIAQAAAKGGISPADVADEEKRKSAMSRIVGEFGRAAVPDSYGIAAMSRPYEEVSSEAVRSLIQDAIEETADRGDVVIVSHGASFTLSRRPDVLRVLLTASPETRMGRLSESRGLDPKEARKAIKAADAARSDYLRRFYGVEAELPTHYDLVVNTDVLSVEQAAEVIAQGAS